MFVISVVFTGLAAFGEHWIPAASGFAGIAASCAFLLMAGMAKVLVDVRRLLRELVIRAKSN
jgi:hypothetical protein